MKTETTFNWRGKLLGCGQNAKTTKGDKASEYLTAILYMAPAQQVPGINLCPMAKQAGCSTACLYRAGRGQMSSVMKSRIAKTEWFRDDRAGFIATLANDIKRFKKYCERHGKKPAIRLNGTSDIQWEVVASDLFFQNPDVQFYDYTKIAKRVRRPLPFNYTLTLSYSNANNAYAVMIERAALDTGCNVAVVYRDKATRDAAMVGDNLTFLSHRVIDGDETDLRFLDPQGVIVGLYAKGPAKRDSTGFVVG